MKYECVMKLREQLDQLGKMKGITQDEKGMFASAWCQCPKRPEVSASKLGDFS